MTTKVHVKEINKGEIYGVYLPWFYMLQHSFGFAV